MCRPGTDGGEADDAAAADGGRPAVAGAGGELHGNTHKINSFCQHFLSYKKKKTSDTSALVLPVSVLGTKISHTVSFSFSFITGETPHSLVLVLVHSMTPLQGVLQTHF